jgi:hypothetical protein
VEKCGTSKCGRSENRVYYCLSTKKGKFCFRSFCVKQMQKMEGKQLYFKVLGGAKAKNFKV